ncbi:hypothetical protein [uncultured Treponema sp.]|uniref:hypothetical protein n=1 Tax=uncultured Treponema sp. TaxID=162155 RepID=UPI0025CC2A04|nr:hypothetical protein [uncultured Treponema sp.]
MKKVFSIIIFLVLLLQLYAQSVPTQGYSYSKQPLNVMGFTKASTITQVKKQLGIWGIKWNVAEQNKNCIQARGVKYEGLFFDYINYYFNDKGKIIEIYFLPADSENDDRIFNSFSSIVKNFPYRNTYSVKYKYITKVYDVFNGYDDTEYVVLDNDLLYFGFCFNGSISKQHGIYP